MVRLRHHVGIGNGELLLAVAAKQRCVSLRLAWSGREDGEIAVAKGRRKEIRLLLLLRLRWEAGRGWAAKGGISLSLVCKVLRQIEGRDSGGARKAGLGEGLG
jgi:hypothetical protein